MEAQGATAHVVRPLSPVVGFGDILLNLNFDKVIAETSTAELFGNNSQQCQLQSVKNKSNQNQSMLEADVTEEEIKGALFFLARNKAPGPDGFNAEFYKATWNIVKDDDIQAIKEFFLNGKLLKEAKATYLALIPKGVSLLIKSR
ncbi:Transposon TX1 putative 149 kDa protein-like protein [Drosera capensis]